MTRIPHYSLRLKVPFYDVDPMHIVWHGHYLKYFDKTRQAFAEKCQLDFYRYKEETGYVFPIIRSMVKHVYPLRFGDEFDCLLFVREVKVKVVLDFEIRLADSDKLCARGQTEQVALRLPEMEMELAIPDHVQKALLALDGA